MGEPIRVLIVLDSLVSAGAERVAVDLACALDRKRYAPMFAITRFGGSLEQRLRDAGVPYEILGRTSRLSVRPIIRLHRLARAHDVIHSHKFGSNVWAALVARTARRPLITHEHNWAEHEGATHRALHRWWIGPRARRVLCVSAEVVETLAGFGVPRGRLLLVPNGVVPVEVYERSEARARLGIAAGVGEVVGIVAALRPVKAHEVLLRAIAQLRDDHQRAVTLCVVGVGTEEARLRSLARELELDEHVVWAGERDDAARVVPAFDVSVLCSHTEGMPLAALEAMSAGVPVVTTAVGSLPELLDDGAGDMVPTDDPIALAAAITTALDRPDSERQQRVAHARARVERQFSHARAVAAIAALYDEAVTTR